MEKETVKILFVCHGNICRSTMAESMMTELVKRNGIADTFEIASAGTSRDEIGNPVYPAAVRVLEAKGIPVVPHKAVQLTKEDYDKYDFLFGFDAANIANMKRIVGGDPENKIHRLLDCCDMPKDIEDPWYTGKFVVTFMDISMGLDEFLISLIRGRSEEEAITVKETLSQDAEES